MIDTSEIVISEVVESVKTEFNKALKDSNSKNYRNGHVDLAARCTICGKWLKEKDKFQFFPGDDSYICNDCQQNIIEEIENIKLVYEKIDKKIAA